VSLFVPAYLIMVMGGFPALRGVLPAAALCGISFAGMQFLVSNYLGPQLTDILASLTSIVSLVVLFRVWRPKDDFVMSGEHAIAAAAPSGTVSTVAHAGAKTHSAGELMLAWTPYGLLVIFVILAGIDPVKNALAGGTVTIPWPGLHNHVMQVAPVVKAPTAYAAVWRQNVLTASGTACLLAAVLSAVVLRMSVAGFMKVLIGTAKQLAFSILTILTVLGLAFLMNYCGATATLGLAFAATGVLFPFFSALLGWMGVFLTGSDTSANALFGNLQVVTANQLGLNPVLMASSNSSGGVMGKMISLQSIAVAAAATGMPAEDESRLFRFTLRHSILLASVLGVIVIIYAYLLPHWVR
jgi:lactate permease